MAHARDAGPHPAARIGAGVALQRLAAEFREPVHGLGGADQVGQARAQLGHEWE
ncbi:hypothetical protein GCM10010335_11890 [Streptomyces galbus]|nr:hypothetical protein GCM10010335_11890 [Streptomyces galbus]